jgi:hypothetical protein
MPSACSRISTNRSRITASFRPTARTASGSGPAYRSRAARCSRSAACRRSKHGCADRPEFSRSSACISEHRRLRSERPRATRSCASSPLVVAGDFNTTPYSPYFGDWLDESGLTDSRRGRTLSVSWPATFPWIGIPIDHVAVNDGFSILSHRRLPNFESDHYGLLIELAQKGPESP